MDLQKKCPICQKEFVCRHYRNRKFCSDVCKNHEKDSRKKMIECFGCKKNFMDSAKKKYCSKKCRTDHTRSMYRTKNMSLNVCSATVGAIGELRVCADLLLKGYNVYRSVSPACGCDLAAIKENKFYRVEVTTGYFDYKGEIINNKKYADSSKFDIVAIVFTTGEITYIPELEPAEK